MMGSGRLHKIEYFQMGGTPESERLKVTALNLFHLTASSPLQKVGFFILRTVSWQERDLSGKQLSISVLGCTKSLEKKLVRPSPMMGFKMRNKMRNNHWHPLFVLVRFLRYEAD